MQRLHSLLPVEEKLLEAEYFADRLHMLSTNEFQYELNAFLSAARNVTFVLQKEMDAVQGFTSWWDECRKAMKRDPAMDFFVELRNFSHHEGRVSIVGTERHGSNGETYWSYRFAGNQWAVPSSLIHRDVAECCHVHLGKLAEYILGFATAFPFHACPRNAVTQAGFEALGLQLSDIEEMLGLPVGCTGTDSIPQAEIFSILQRHFDGIGFETIERIAGYEPLQEADMFAPSGLLSDRLARRTVEALEDERNS